MNDHAPSDADAPAEDGGRELPWDLLAEQSAIGSMLLAAAAVDVVFDEAKLEDFYRPSHTVIAETVRRLALEGQPTEPLAVIDELTKSGDLPKAGGADYILQLHGIPATAANAGYYARIVHEHAVRRRVIAAATRMMNSAYAREREVAEVVEAARLEVDTVETGRRRQIRRIGDSLDELVESLGSKPTYMPTPWESIDQIIGGFTPGSFYVVAARPGSGKTIAVLQSAVSLAHQGVVAFSSIEMSEQELQQRLIAQHSNLHLSKLRNHTLDEDDWKTFARTRGNVSGAPIFVDPSPKVTLADIRAHARAVSRRGKLAGIVVDYLQLIQGEGQDRRVVVDNIALGLKGLAKDMNVPVIAAAQLKRAAPQRGKKRTLPTLEDLREAGGIEANADVVMLLDRGVAEEARDLTVVVAKNRHGDQRQVTLRWEAEYARLVDRRWSPTALIDNVEQFEERADLA